MTTEEEIAQLRGIAESTDSRLASIQESNLGIHTTLRLMNVTLLDMRTEARDDSKATLDTLRQMLPRPHGILANSVDIRSTDRKRPRKSPGPLGSCFGSVWVN